MRVKFRVFKSFVKSWETICAEAAEFAEQIPPELLISISHSGEQSAGIVIVWYRGK